MIGWIRAPSSGCYLVGWLSNEDFLYNIDHLIGLYGFMGCVAVACIGFDAAGNAIGGLIIHDPDENAANALTEISAWKTHHGDQYSTIIGIITIDQQGRAAGGLGHDSASIAAQRITTLCRQLNIQVSQVSHQKNLVAAYTNNSFQLVVPPPPPPAAGINRPSDSINRMRNTGPAFVAQERSEASSSSEPRDRNVFWRPTWFFSGETRCTCKDRTEFKSVGGPLNARHHCRKCGQVCCVVCGTQDLSRKGRFDPPFFSYWVHKDRCP